MNTLDSVLSFIADHNVDAYFVGGLVRDEILGRRVKHDIDVAVSGDAIELAREFADAHGGAFYPMDEDHDVARVILRDTTIDFAGMRGSLRDDLSTRDFTINAMARHFGSMPLMDPFHGRDDLRDKIIRAVSDDVFKDDPVRLLRALRFAGELEFDLDAHTVDLIKRDAPLLKFAAMERARDELCKILALSNPTQWLRRAHTLGLLTALIPEIAALATTTQSAPHVFNVFDHTLRVLDELEKIQVDHYVQVAGGELALELHKHFAQTVSADHSRAVMLRLAALVHDIAKPATRSEDKKGAVHFYRHEERGAEMVEEILRRLRFSKDETELVSKIVAQHLRPLLLAEEPQVTNRAVYRFFRDAGEAGIDVCALALADRRGTYAAETPDKNDARVIATLKILLEKYFRATQTVVAPPALIDGHALMQALKIQPGKHVGELLEAIREAQAEGEVKSRAEAIAYTRGILNTEDAEGTEKDVKRKTKSVGMREARKSTKAANPKAKSEGTRKARKSTKDAKSAKPKATTKAKSVKPKAKSNTLKAKPKTRKITKKAQPGKRKS